MLKKTIFAAALVLGLVTSFQTDKGEVVPSKVEMGSPAGACCDPWDTDCCRISGACCS